MEGRNAKPNCTYIFYHLIHSHFIKAGQNPFSISRKETSCINPNFSLKTGTALSCLCQTLLGTAKALAVCSRLGAFVPICKARVYLIVVPGISQDLVDDGLWVKSFNKHP